MKVPEPKEGFTYAVNAEGYMIYYCGKPIGGAGIKGKSKSRGKNRIADIKEYRQQAERDIECLKQGKGYPHMIDAIKRIDDFYKADSTAASKLK